MTDQITVNFQIKGKIDLVEEHNFPDDDKLFYKIRGYKKALAQIHKVPLDYVSYIIDTEPTNELTVTGVLLCNWCGSNYDLLTVTSYQDNHESILCRECVEKAEND